MVEPRKVCMPYRRTKKYSAERLEAMRRGKDRARQERPAPDCPPELPELRMRITVERFDAGEERHVFELRRTRRVDVYLVSVDGRLWKSAGLTAVLEGLRKACPRVTSMRAL
jgi:hypothetical protein